MNNTNYEEMRARLSALSSISKTKLSAQDAAELASIRHTLEEEAVKAAAKVVKEHAPNLEMLTVSSKKTASIAALAELDMSQIIGMEDPDWSKIPEALLRLQSAHSAAGAYLTVAVAVYENYRRVREKVRNVLRAAAPFGYTEADYEALVESSFSELCDSHGIAKAAVHTARAACECLAAYFSEVSRIQAALEYDLKLSGGIGTPTYSPD